MRRDAVGLQLCIVGGAANINAVRLAATVLVKPGGNAARADPSPRRPVPVSAASGVRLAMRSTIQAALLAVVVLGSSSIASAVWVDSAVDYIGCGRQRNADWPWPYMCPDRMAVRRPFEMMVCNGWRRQNLLGSYHFNHETNKLNTAGQLQVQWIMTQAPQQHRQIFVEDSLNPTVTAQRLASVQGYAQRVAINGESPQVYDTHMMSEGRPASVVDFTNVRFLENMPIPTLPARDPDAFSSE